LGRFAAPSIMPHTFSTPLLTIGETMPDIANALRRDRPIPAALFLTALLAAGAPPAQADPAALLAAADPTRVDQQAKKCAKCHGDEGVSDDPEVPHLATQRASYIFRQLQDFKADNREGGRMNKTAKKLSDQEMADLAARFSALPLPADAGVSTPAAPALVTEGDAARNIDACADCHAADGRGKHDKYDAPALAGAPLTYFVATMQSFRDGVRANDADGVMGSAAKDLSDAEIEALAGYYLALGGRKPMPPE